MAITLANLNGVAEPRFAEQVREASFNKLALYNSGAIKMATPQELGISFNSGARIAAFPYWNIQNMDHTELVDANTATAAVADTAGEQIGRILYRGRAWGASFLAKQLIGSDPLTNVAEKIGEFWANNYHTAALSIMAGLFENLAAAGIGVTQGIDDHYVDSTGAGQVTGTILKRGVYAMGDQFTKVKLAIMHSDVYQIIEDNEDVVMVPDGNGRIYPTLRGTKIELYVDDSMPSGAGVVGADESAVYMFGEGAFIMCPFEEYLKPAEDETTGVIAIHNRKPFLLHPNGFSWQSVDPGAAGNLSPTNAELANGLNWLTEWQTANIPIVRQDVSLV
jgi:hypothetical protein